VSLEVKFEVSNVSEDEKRPTRKSLESEKMAAKTAFARPNSARDVRQKSIKVGVVPIILAESAVDGTTTQVLSLLKSHVSPVSVWM
jgi:hypothetical protein